MKRISVAILMFLSAITYLAGQSFDWNIRGGINIMDAKTKGKDVAVLYHAGAEAGIRIANFGFYGELLYSVHENQDGGDPVSYFVPAILMKGYPRKILLLEMGGAIVAMAGSSDVADNTLNPDKTAYAFAGLGLHISKFDLSMRTNLKKSYPIIQVTLAVNLSR